MTLLLDGRYHLESELARGAIGVVWRAVDRTTGESLAVKILTREMAGTPACVAGLRRESQLLADLDHPGVVRVRAETCVDGIPAFVMDLAGGGDLRQALVAGGSFAPELVALVGAQVADALAHVHGRGIVHGDIKPANLLIRHPLDRGGASGWQRPVDTASTVDLTGTVDLVGPSAGLRPIGMGAEIEVLLADFGVARRTGEHSGPVHATPEYIAPEVIAGDVPEPPADVYALGITLYELACGRTPFRGGDPAAVLSRQSTGIAVPPRGMPGELWSAVAACLRKVPQSRPTAAAVAAQLRVAAAALRGVPASPPLPVDAVTWLPEVAGRPVATPVQDHPWDWVPLPTAWGFPASAGSDHLIAMPAQSRIPRPSRTRASSGGVLALAAGLVAVLIGAGVLVWSGSYGDVSGRLVGVVGQDMSRSTAEPDTSPGPDAPSSDPSAGAQPAAGDPAASTAEPELAESNAPDSGTDVVPNGDLPGIGDPMPVLSGGSR